MPITLKQIAEKAGVSKPVVSAVLNNRSRNSRVSAATRSKIEAIAAQYHYLPNTTAQSLSGTATKTVHLVIPSFKFFQVEQYAHIVSSLQAYLYNRGYMLQVTSLQYEFRNDTLIRNIQTDGIVLFYWGGKKQLVTELEKLGRPMVVLNARYDCDRISNVYVDERSGMYDLTRKILAAGHRHITHIGTFMGDLTHREGLEGIRQAAADTPDAKVHSITIPYGNDDRTAADYDISIGRRGLELASEQSPRPTVVMYNSDLIAMAGMQRAAELGLRIPEDISITGCGDLKVAATSVCPLTTTGNISMETGQCAGELILEHIGNDTAPARQIAVPARAVIRSSLALFK